MKHRMECSIFAVVFLSIGLWGQMTFSADSRIPSELIYNRPAAHWEEDALPIGNGSIGGMVFGYVGSDRIQFNEDTLWTGTEKSRRGDYSPFGDILISLDESPVLIPQFTTLRYNDHRLSYELSVDGDPETMWEQPFTLNGAPIVWEIEYADKPSEPVRSYTITSATAPTKFRPAAKPPQSWVFQGSDDGKRWTQLDSQQGDAFWSQPYQERTFVFESDTNYTHYRFLFMPVIEPSREDLKKKRHPQVHSVGEIRVGTAQPVVSNYSRKLFMGTGLQRVSYESGGVQFTREYFCSYPDQVLVVRLTADQPGQYTGAVRLKDAHLTAGVTEGQRLSFKGVLEDNDLGYEAQMIVLNDGGALEPAAQGKLRFKGADSLTLILSLGTDYKADITKGWRGEDPHSKLIQRIDQAAAQDYETLLKRHEEDFSSLFDRVTLKIQGDNKKQDLSTDQRLNDYRAGGADNELETLLFQFGRYLLISSSRPGSLPANLQGLWNCMWKPQWGSDYHFNINLQMCYWLAGPANLNECREPLFDYLLSQIPGWRLRMEEEFAAGGSRWKKLPRGWSLRTNANIFGYTGFKHCETAPAWLMQDFWEYYAFTQNEEFLRNVAYPNMKTVVEYWEDRLVRTADGKLVVPDGWSPEHGPQEDGVTFDQELVWDLLTNFLTAGEILGVDLEYRQTVSQMRDDLLKPQIGRWGQIQEWMTDRDDPADNHRHISHLVGLFPGKQISPIRSPALADAASVTLNARKAAYGKYKLNGWSRAWMTSLCARLYDGEGAHEQLRRLITERVNNNMMSECPPICLDASFGGTMGICEMLLQSQNDEIHLLPAMPAVWAAGGKVTGLRARGGFTVDIEWNQGMLKEVRIKSLSGNVCRVRAPVEVGSVAGAPAIRRTESTWKGTHLIEFDTEKDGIYTIKI
jgi:alpha-L-fucosidase 2